MTKKFHGILPALATPMKSGGDVDFPAYQKLIDWLIDCGVHGLVPVGTTGESPTLSHDEHGEVIQYCVKVAKGRVPVIAGTGSNSTAEAIRLTKHAEKANVDAALLVTPYYNKPTQNGLYAHFKAVADSVKLPIIIYNIPGRCIVDMSDETMVRLANDCKNIIGVKDATNNLTRPCEGRLNIGDDFIQLSGEDGTFAAFLGQGGDGIISVAANVAPELYVRMYDAWKKSDLQEFASCRDKLYPLSQALFCESSPAPLKYALSLRNICGPDLRLPLLPATQMAQERVNHAMRHAGLI